MRRLLSIFTISILNVVYAIAQDNNIEVLNSAYSRKDWPTFANNFTYTFTEFLTVYGYDEQSGPMPLYFEGFNHIQFLFSNDRILENHYLEKLLKLTEGYQWEADGANYLSMQIESLISNYPYEISEFMNDKPNPQVKDFLKCAIATPYPEPENTNYYKEYLALVNLYEVHSPKIARLLETAHKELMDEWVEK